MMFKTTATGRGQLGATLRRAAALCLLALAALWCQAREARAQWTTAGTSTTTTNNVGIGTTNPATAKLVVSGTAGATGLDLSSTDQYSEMRVIRNSLNPGDKDLFLQWQAGAGSKIHFYSNNGETMTLNAGHVGIGTASPVGLLHVSGVDTQTYVSSAISSTRITVQNTDTTNNTFGQLAFRTTDVNGTSADAARIYSIYTSHAANAVSGDLAFVTRNAGTSGEVARFTASGNVGIGTTAPASKLHVVGDITVTGNINAKYQDVAEWVPATEHLAAGTVVVLDTQHANHVNASTKAYDTRAAGVISAQPGLTLGEGGEGKALVATTGRVKVRVDATRAPIGIGDLLVTSDTPGVAMRSEPVNVGGVSIHRPGTIIGKALEPLEKGTGEILVLLSLQ